MKIYILIIFFLSIENLNAQNKTSSDSIFSYVEQMPEYPGGYYEMLKYVSNNLNHYIKLDSIPQNSTCVINFIVDKNGNLSDFIVKKSCSKLLDEEIIRVLKSMPQWIPAKQNNENVSVKYSFPLKLCFK